MVKSLGVVLFCYTVGLAAGSTFLSDLKRQWTLMVAGIVGLVAMAAAALGIGSLCGLSNAHVAGLYAGAKRNVKFEDSNWRTARTISRNTS